MTQHTRQSVHDLIQSRWESDTPDRVLQALQKFSGKPITIRIEKHLNALDPQLAGGGWRLVRHYGWTDLQNEAYWLSQGSHRDGVSLMLAYSEGAVDLDLAWMEAKNTAYFDARKARNHARMEALNTAGTLDALALAMNNAERAIELMTDARSRLEDLTSHGTTGDPDRYAIMRVCGLSDGDGHDFGDRLYKGRAK